MSRPAQSGDVWASWFFMVAFLLILGLGIATAIISEIRTDLRAIQPCTQVK